MRFYRSNRIRTTLTPSKDSAKRKREEEAPRPPGPRITFKQSKLHHASSPSHLQPVLQPLPKLHLPNFSAAPPQPSAMSPGGGGGGGGAPPPRTPSTPVSSGGGPLKLKLKFGQPQQK